MASPIRAPLAFAFSLAMLALAGCGLGQNSGSDNAGTVGNPIVAATVNGRPIYVEDVRQYAVSRGWIQETEDLSANSDAATLALEELVQIRLFSMEAEGRGLDRQPGIRRQLENARERVLAAAIYEEIAQHAVDPARIEQLYREHANQLGRGDEVHLRHMQFETREAADAAKRRLDQGERFEALAFELSIERDSAPDGGDLGFSAIGDLTATMREQIERATVGGLIGPIQLQDGWHIFRVDDRRSAGGPSLEELRPRISQWLAYQETAQLTERLSRDARIEYMQRGNEPATPVEEDAGAPATAEPARPAPSPAPQNRPPLGQAPPPFPFPLASGAAEPAAPAPTPAEQSSSDGPAQ
jgi:peptidyl-prolyl cis-trans isomerase C